jgi:hypothetical protein
MKAPILPACNVTIVGTDMMRRLALVPLLALSIGCTQQKGGPMPTHYEDALSQLDKAATSKSVGKQPDAVSQALLPPLVVEMPRAEGKAAESRFDLAVNNAPAPEVFMAIASGSPYSMIVHPGITGNRVVSTWGHPATGAWANRTWAGGNWGHHHHHRHFFVGGGLYAFSGYSYDCYNWPYYSYPYNSCYGNSYAW